MRYNGFAILISVETFENFVLRSNDEPRGLKLWCPESAQQENEWTNDSRSGALTLVSGKPHFWILHKYDWAFRSIRSMCIKRP